MASTTSTSVRSASDGPWSPPTVGDLSRDEYLALIADGRASFQRCLSTGAVSAGWRDELNRVLHFAVPTQARVRRIASTSGLSLQRG